MEGTRVFSGYKLRCAREDRGLGRGRLRKAIGCAVTVETLRNYETGKTAPDMNTAAKIAAALGVGLDDLMDNPRAQG